MCFRLLVSIMTDGHFVDSGVIEGGVFGGFSFNCFGQPMPFVAAGDGGQRSVTDYCPAIVLFLHCPNRCLKVQRPAKSARARGPRHASSRLQVCPRSGGRPALEVGPP